MSSLSSEDLIRSIHKLLDGSMQTNNEGLNLLHSFEGCKLESYQDIVGVWTIGYGTTGPDIVKGLKWTQQQVDDRFKKDLAKFESGVSAAVKVPMTSNQFSALVCFAYNVGIQAMAGSTLVKLLNSGKTAEAADQFLRWNKAGGKEVKGLTRRREAERALFLKPEVQSAKATSILPDGPSDDEIKKKLLEAEKGLKK
jgi:lysozyme